MSKLIQLSEIQLQGPRFARGPLAGSRQRPLSPSQIKNWLKCSWAWHARSNLKLAEASSAALVIGRALHTVASHFYGTVIRNVPASQQDTVNLFALALTAELETANLPADERDGIEERAGKILAQWWGKVAPHTRPAIVEQTITGEVGGVYVLGILDCEEADGTISDLKTKNKKPYQRDAGDAFQLALYAEIRNAPRVRINYVYPTGHVPYTWDVTSDERRFVRQLLPVIAESMNSGLVTPNRHGTLCSHTYCSFADACEREWGGIVKP